MSHTATAKRCTKCGEVQPLDEFYREARQSDGRRSDCKRCRAESDRGAARERQRRWFAANGDRRRERDRQRYETDPDPVLERARRRAARLSAAVFAHYGTSCACCGTSDDLAIDHVNGDGADHRTELFGDADRTGTQFYVWLKANGFPDGFQTLCRRCNTSKGVGERCKLHH